MLHNIHAMVNILVLGSSVKIKVGFGNFGRYSFGKIGFLTVAILICRCHGRLDTIWAKTSQWTVKNVVKIHRGRIGVPMRPRWISPKNTCETMSNQETMRTKVLTPAVIKQTQHNGRLTCLHLSNITCYHIHNHVRISVCGFCWLPARITGITNSININLFSIKVNSICIL